MTTLSWILAAVARAVRDLCRRWPVDAHADDWCCDSEGTGERLWIC